MSEMLKDPMENPAEEYKKGEFIIPEDKAKKMGQAAEALAGLGLSENGSAFDDDMQNEEVPLTEEQQEEVDELTLRPEDVDMDALKKMSGEN